MRRGFFTRGICCMERIRYKVEAKFNSSYGLVISAGGASMLVWRTLSPYRQKEAEIYDKICEVSDEVSRLSEAGMDTTEAFRRLEAALAEFELFRCIRYSPLRGKMDSFPGAVNQFCS